MNARLCLLALLLLMARPARAQVVTFPTSAAAAEKLCHDAIERAGNAFDKLAAMPEYKRTFANTVAEFERINEELDQAVGPVLFLKDTSPNKALQDAAVHCNDEVSAFYARVYARADLYRALELVARGVYGKACDKTLPDVDLQDSKLLDETLRHFRRSGAALAEAERQEVERLKQELTATENQFEKNVAESNDTIALDPSDLQGTAPDFAAALPKEHGGYLLPLLDASLYFPFMENAPSESARRKVYVARQKVAAASNVPLLEKAIALRHRIAVLLGFPNHAAYVLDAKMAHTPQRVAAFLGDLRTRLRPLLEEDVRTLLALKREDDAKATRLQAWDWRYYGNVLKKKRFSVDDEEVRQYFPVDHVFATVFGIYQKVLGVRFEEVKPARAWWPDVRLFAVYDKDSGSLLGHFFVDLYPRPNKYKHFAAFDILHAHDKQRPVSAIVGNFPKPVAGKPALLRHDEVETFFHEFGHIMHMTLTQARYASLAGTNVRDDFVEAPSQMLENWVWEPTILRQLSRHYRTGKRLPDKLIGQLVASRHLHEGLSWSFQLLYAQVDMDYHSDGDKVDTTAIWNRRMLELTTLDTVPDTHPQATFDHFMGGYDAGYYGYLWSKVYAQDMFTVFEQSGLQSATAGARYRKWILEPGGTQEPDVLIRGFLGRDPNYEAFYRSLGLGR